MYSEPGGELGKRLYNVQTGNRRFTDDASLIPARFTKGKKTIQVKCTFVPLETERYPGKPFPKEGAWSELSYEVYSYVLPAFTKQ